MAPSGPSTTETTDSNAVTPRDNEQRYRRAREVLADAGWLFDDFVNAEMRRVLTSDPDDMTTREIAYNRARIATELKAGLAALIEQQEARAHRKERRDSLMGAFHGR